MTPYTPNEDDVTVFAETNFRNESKRFGIKRKDRRLHMYLIGKTGMGKSTLMENMIRSDLKRGEGLAVIDPHGDLVEKARLLVPKERQSDLVYFNPAELSRPLGLNVLETNGGLQNHLLASELVSVFKKIWKDSWGPRTEYILRNTILALLDVPQATLLDAPRLLADKEYRAAALLLLRDEPVRDFWVNEFEKYSAYFRSEAIAPIQNKIGQLLTSRVIRTVIGQKKSSFNLREVMDEGKILLANLAKGRMGEDASYLLGAILLTKIELAALGRAELREDQRRDFYVFIDEVFNVAANFANTLSETRKYKVSLVLSHQYIEQLDEGLQAAVFGNVGTLVSFRLGARDGEVLAKEFYPVFTQNDLLNLPPYHVALKLVIDGVSASPFSATTLPPLNQGFVERVAVDLNTL